MRRVYASKTNKNPAQNGVLFIVRYLKVKPDVIFIQDGNLYTSAGITAGIDLALALVEEG